MCVSDNEWCESVGVSLCDCEDGGVCFHISDSALYVAQPPVPAMPYFHFIRLSLLQVPCPECLLYMYLRCYDSTPQAMHIGDAHCLTRVNLCVFLDPPTSEVGPIESLSIVCPSVR